MRYLFLAAVVGISPAWADSNAGQTSSPLTAPVAPVDRAALPETPPTPLLNSLIDRANGRAPASTLPRAAEPAPQAQPFFQVEPGTEQSAPTRFVKPAQDLTGF